MFRRLFRWLFRLIELAIVLFIVAVIVDYFTHRVQPGSVLVVKLKGQVVERGGGVTGMFGATQTPLNIVRKALDDGASDQRIDGLAIEIFDPRMELAQAQELCAMTREFASHGKWTAAYLETAGESGPGNLPYLVASAAQRVAMMPQGELNLVGVGIRELFARGLLDKLGIKPQLFAIGKYKTAANIFTQQDFTPAQHEEDVAIVNGMFNQIVGQAASQRKLTPDSIKEMVDQAPLTAHEALKLHLIDRLGYLDQFTARIKHRGERKHALLDYRDYERPWLIPPWGHRAKIAVIYGLGAIESGRGGFDPLLSPGGSAMGSDVMTAAFRHARQDHSIKAVIFRVDSPGGSVIASELIRRQVELTARKKPVVVSMSGFGASGGYWISTPAAKIFADPGTLTGSIGVLGGKFNISGAATKIGVNSGEVSQGANVSMFDGFTDFTPAQQKIFQDRILGRTYQYFLKLVAARRHMTVAQVNAIAQGRVWTGEQAAGNKLIDSLGGFNAALTEAKKLAKIGPHERIQLINLPRQPGLVEQLLGGDMVESSRPSAVTQRILAPFIRLITLPVARSAEFGQAYCPLAPVM